MKNKFHTYMLFLFVCFWVTLNYPASIIFDLDGVLIEKSGFWTAQNIGFRHFLGFYNPYKVRKKMFEFFDTLEARRTETPWVYNQDLLLPQLICDWLLGEKTNNQLLTIIRTALSQKKYTFSKKKYLKLTKLISEFMFSPKRLAETMQPIKEGVELLKTCKLNNHKVYVISNWDAESYDHLCTLKWFKEIVSICDGVVISAKVHLIKPDPRIFEHLFTTYDIDPDTDLTVYIDDTRENIMGARVLQKKQLRCFECKNKKFEPIKKELKSLGIIS